MFIELSECVDRGIYQVKSRNMVSNVAICQSVEQGKFIGLRRKLGRLRLDTEYHTAVSRDFGTLRVELHIGTLPDDISTDLHLGAYCSACHSLVLFDGIWRCPKGCRFVRPVTKSNVPLTLFLIDFIKRKETISC